MRVSRISAVPGILRRVQLKPAARTPRGSADRAHEAPASGKRRAVRLPRVKIDGMTTPAARKKIIIIAGPNGAGKTTFARAFLPDEANLPRFINADLIAAGLAPFAPETAAVRAGRLMLDEIRRCARRGDAFAFETTLSGIGYVRRIRQWREQGYRVSMFFLSLPDPEIAIARVAERVRQGGHNVPEPVIRRRFASGLRNFHERYKMAVDDWALYDNAGSSPIMLDWGENP